MKWDPCLQRGLPTSAACALANVVVPCPLHLNSVTQTILSLKPAIKLYRKEVKSNLTKKIIVHRNMEQTLSASKCVYLLFQKWMETVITPCSKHRKNQMRLYLLKSVDRRTAETTARFKNTWLLPEQWAILATVLPSGVAS